LEEKKRVKATAGGRGSRARRRKRRKMQQLQYRQTQELENEMPDDTNDFSVVITEDGPDEHTRVLPVPTWAKVLARYNDRPGGQHSSPDLHQQLLHNIQAEWAGTQTHRTVAPDGRNSSPAISFQHPGTELGVHSIPKRWPKQEKMAAKNENSNNDGHLLTLLMDQMKTLQSELNELKHEQKLMIKTSDKMQSSIKRFREYKEKDIYCWHCHIYTAAVHHCSVAKEWIHLDRFNRLITYSSTEEGANPKDPNDISDCITMSIPRFAIDNRNMIMIDRKEKEAEMKNQQWIEARAQELSQLMEIIFGESGNLEITEELSKHLGQFKTLEEFHKSDARIHVNNYLSCHPMTVFPKGILSAEQWSSFNQLREPGKVQYTYNFWAKERKEKEAERKMQAQETTELMLKRQEEQRQQMELIRQRQHESFEESVRQRMRMNNLY
jgi:hypothetical protein